MFCSHSALLALLVVRRSAAEEEEEALAHVLVESEGCGCLTCVVSLVGCMVGGIRSWLARCGLSTRAAVLRCQECPGVCAKVC